MGFAVHSLVMAENDAFHNKLVFSQKLAYRLSHC